MPAVPPNQVASTDDYPCPLDTTFRFDDPESLLLEFVRREAEGPFEQLDIAERWRAGALLCPDRADGEHYEVITGFSVHPLQRTTETALVEIRRDRAFRVERSPEGDRLIEDNRTWADTARLVHTTYGWRIDALARGAYRLPGMARGELNLSPADRRTLERLERSRS